MSKIYYNLEMSGEAVETALKAVPNKLDQINGVATNLKLYPGSEITENTQVTNKEYVDTAISRYTVLNDGNLKVGAAELNLNSTYLHIIDNKKIKLANNSQIDFGVAGQILTSGGNGEAPQWADQKEIVIIEPNNDDSDDELLNGVSSIATDTTNSHRLLVTKDSFIRAADLENVKSPIGAVLATKVDLSDFTGPENLFIGQADNLPPRKLDIGNLGQVLKIVPSDENPDVNIISWADEKGIELDILDDDSDDSPEDAISVVSSLTYNEPVLEVLRGQTVDYTAYKAFETAINTSLLDKATKDELSHKADKTELGDQFIMEFDNETGTLLITKK